MARETSADKMARTFTPWSHVLALLCAPLTHCIRLNDVCDALGLHSGPLSSEQFAQGILGCVPNELGHFLYEYQGTGGPLI